VHLKHLVISNYLLQPCFTGISHSQSAVLYYTLCKTMFFVIILVYTSFLHIKHLSSCSFHQGNVFHLLFIPNLHSTESELYSIFYTLCKIHYAILYLASLMELNDSQNWEKGKLHVIIHTTALLPFILLHG